MANLIAPAASALLAAALAVAASAPARAQCRLCDKPTTAAPSLASKERISLNVEATLDFDRLVLHGAGEGSATILPNGDRRSSGSVAAISGRAMVGAVVIRGEPGRAVRVELPSRVRLYTLTGGSISIVPEELNQRVEITPDTAIVRLGSIHVAPARQIAAAN